MKTYNYHDRALKKAKFDTGVQGEKPLELSLQMQAGIMRLVQKKRSFRVISFELNGRQVSDTQLDLSLLNRGLIEDAPDPQDCSYWAQGKYRKVTKKGRHIAKLIWESVKDESAEIRKVQKAAQAKREEARDEAEGVASDLKKALVDSGIKPSGCRKSWITESTEVVLGIDQARALTKLLRGKE